MTPLPLRDRLRAATGEIHAATEALPFQEAIRFRNLPERGYEEYLRAFHSLRMALEDGFRTAEDARVRGVWDPAMARAPRIAADLEGTVGKGAGATIAGVRGLLAAHLIRVSARRDPLSLLGFAYVLEGATQGGMVLAKDLRRGQAVERLGTSFLEDAGPRALRRQWREFVERLDEVALTDSETQVVVDGATRLFRQIHGLIGALHPLRVAQHEEIARELNPEAGSHPVVVGERALEAAVRAGERSWAEFPYYEARYGERGRGYTRSDSAWLAALAGLTEERAIEQVAWLAQVLSGRGMPQWLMERHLRLLHEELEQAEPGGQWSHILSAADALAALRRPILSDENLEVARGRWGEAPIPEAGVLLAAAVADEALGIEQAVPALTRWLLDSERFPESWVTEGERLLATLRREVGSSSRAPTPS